jgi:hypothetical protein
MKIPSAFLCELWSARRSLVHLADCNVSAMVIARSPCSGGPLRAGNQAQEAGRHPSQYMDAKGVIPLDCERASPSASESDSASLR